MTLLNFKIYYKNLILLIIYLFIIKNLYLKFLTKTLTKIYIKVLLIKKN